MSEPKLLPWREAWNRWHARDEDDDNRDLCEKCHVVVSTEYGCEPSPFCNGCTQELAELVMTRPAPSVLPGLKRALNILSKMDETDSESPDYYMAVRIAIRIMESECAALESTAAPVEGAGPTEAQREELVTEVFDIIDGGTCEMLTDSVIKNTARSVVAHMLRAEITRAQEGKP